MSDQKKKSVNLEEPLSSWEALNGRQLKAIYRMLTRGYSMTEFKLRVFLLLTGLRIRKRAQREEDGTFTYFFRRKGWIARIRNERLRMVSWELSYWIDKYMKFLDTPVHIVQLPFAYKWVAGRRYKAPEYRMTDVTYEQYGNAQRYLAAYWDCQALCESMLKNGASRKAIHRARSQELDARAGFLAHLYISPSFQLTDSRHHGTRLSLQRVYHYDSERAERNKRRFRMASKYLFDLTVWYFQSCLQEYSEDFPHLFKSHGGPDGKNAIVMEVGTVNAVQKYAGYTVQQDVYDTNAIFVFDILNSMQHEAEEIDKLNRKTK